jgi:hypothetical protein
VYVLNKVEQKGHVSEVELRKLIKEDLEKGQGFEMDKKTLKRIIENLREVELVKTKDFPIYLPNSNTVSDVFNKAREKDEDGEFVPSELDQESNFTSNAKPVIKQLVLAPDCNLSVSELSKNPTIANPTNRQTWDKILNSDKNTKRKAPKPKDKMPGNFLQDLGDGDEYYSDSDKEYNSNVDIQTDTKRSNTRQMTTQ